MSYFSLGCRLEQYASNIWNILQRDSIGRVVQRALSRGLKLRAGCVVDGARGPIAKTGALHGRHLFAVSRMEHFSTPLYISRAYRGYLSPKRKTNGLVLENIHETERSKLISEDYHL